MDSFYWVSLTKLNDIPESKLRIKRGVVHADYVIINACVARDL
jgi:hypothetical protein